MRSLAALLLVAATVAAQFDGPPSYELFNYNPVADPAAVTVIGAARFTVLTV